MIISPKSIKKPFQKNYGERVDIELFIFFYATRNLSTFLRESFSLA